MLSLQITKDHPRVDHSNLTWSSERIKYNMERNDALLNKKTRISLANLWFTQVAGSNSQTTETCALFIGYGRYF